MKPRNFPARKYGRRILALSNLMFALERATDQQNRPRINLIQGQINVLEKRMERGMQYARNTRSKIRRAS